MDLSMNSGPPVPSECQNAPLVPGKSPVVYSNRVKLPTVNPSA